MVLTWVCWVCSVGEPCVEYSEAYVGHNQTAESYLLFLL